MCSIIINPPTDGAYLFKNKLAVESKGNCIP